MKEDGNDRLYGQTSSGQQQNRGSQSNQESWGKEESLAGSRMDNDPEYSSSDEIEDLQDDEFVSRVDEEEDDLIDDENSQMNQQGWQGSEYNSDTQNR